MIPLAIILLQSAATAPPTSPTLSSADGRSCNLFLDEADEVSRRPPSPKVQVAIVEQRVDCHARSVTRVVAFRDRRIAMKAFRKVQATADRFACSTPLNRLTASDGWSFRIELVGPERHVVTAIGHGDCGEQPAR